MSILSLAFTLFVIQNPFTPSYTSETFSRPWRSTRAIHVNSFRNLYYMVRDARHRLGTWGSLTSIICKGKGSESTNEQERRYEDEKLTF